MEPILNKTEIAELLQAIREGKVPLELDEVDQDSFLKCEPVNLFQLTHRSSEQFRIPNFDIIIDLFCRLYGTSLTNQLQRNFSITKTSLETAEFQKFLSSRANPGAIAILDMPPLKYGSLIVYDSKLSFPLIEMMLGAASDLEPVSMERQLTTIELNVLKTIIRAACIDVDRAFSQLLQMKTSLVKLENNPRLVSIVEPEAEVIVATLLVKVGDLAGELYLVFPFVTLEPLREALRQLLNIQTVTKSSWQNVLEETLQDVVTNLIVQSGTIKLSINDILGIKEGDILELPYNPNAPLRVLVEDKQKFYAIPGTHNGKKAISLTAVINE
jgi:flagellar motor switch protein FliM